MDADAKNVFKAVAVVLFVAIFVACLVCLKSVKFHCDTDITRWSSQRAGHASYDEYQRYCTIEISIKTENYAIEDGKSK